MLRGPSRRFSCHCLGTAGLQTPSLGVERRLSKQKPRRRVNSWSLQSWKVAGPGRGRVLGAGAALP